MKSRISALIKLTCISVIPLSFVIKSFAREQPTDPQIKSLIKALEQAKKPLDNMRVKFSKERNAGFSVILGTQPVKQESYTHSLLDYTVTISGIRSRIDRETKKVNKEINNEAFDITRSIEVRDGTFFKELNYKPNQNDIPKTGFINFADANHSDMSYFAYGWPRDITRTFLRTPSSFRLVSSIEPDIYILELTDIGVHRVYIDSQKSFNIVKWQLLNATGNIILGELNYELKQTKDGIWYPSEYQRIDSPILPSGEQSPPVIAEITRIKSAEFNIDIPDDTFDLEFPVGTKVMDNVIGDKYIVSDSNSPEIEDNSSEKQPSLLRTIRERVQNNLEKFQLIKMDWSVEKEYMSRDSYGFYTFIEGTWAQDGNLQYCNQDAFSNGEFQKGYITVIDGKVHKWGSKPDFMSGNITPIEKFIWTRNPVTYLGIRLFDSRHSITDVLTPEHAWIEDEIQEYNGRSVYVINIIEPEKPKNRAKVYIDTERNMPINIKYRDKHPKTGEDRFVCEVKNIELYQLPNDGWFPVSGSRCLYFDDSLRRYDADHIKVDVNSITIDRENISEELFKLDFSEGAKVYNEILGKMTIIGQGG